VAQVTPVSHEAADVRSRLDLPAVGQLDRLAAEEVRPRLGSVGTDHGGSPVGPGLSGVRWRRQEQHAQSDVGERARDEPAQERPLLAACARRSRKGTAAASAPWRSIRRGAVAERARSSRHGQAVACQVPVNVPAYPSHRYVPLRVLPVSNPVRSHPQIGSVKLVARLLCALKFAPMRLACRLPPGGDARPATRPAPD
jgi:hypothetical protein